MLTRALERETRVRAAIDRSELPYEEVTTEVERLLTTMRQTAGRAQQLHECLEDVRPDAITDRLEELRAEGDADRTELVGALTQQLKGQRDMEAQLRRFYDQMEQFLVELEMVRSNLVSASTAEAEDNQVGLAADVRDLRVEMRGVRDDMAAAYDKQVEPDPLLIAEPH